MKALFELFRDLVLFRRAPQDLPHSPALLGALILIDLVVTLAVAQALESNGRNLVGLALLQVCLLLGLPYIVLQLSGRVARFNQTASALVGVDLVFTIIAIPVLPYLPELEAVKPGTPVTGFHLLLSIAVIVLMLWQTGVRGHVLRHALDVGFPQGVLIAVIFFFVEQVLLASLGAGTGAAQ